MMESSVSQPRGKLKWYEVFHLVEKLSAPSPVKHLLITIYAHTNHRKGFSWLSQEKIADAMGVTSRTVQRAFRDAQRLGVVSVRRIRTGKNPKDQYNEFWLNLDKICELTTRHNDACSNETTRHNDAHLGHRTHDKFDIEHTTNRARTHDIKSYKVVSNSGNKEAGSKGGLSARSAKKIKVSVSSGLCDEPDDADDAPNLFPKFTSETPNIRAEAFRVISAEFPELSTDVIHAVFDAILARARSTPRSANFLVSAFRAEAADCKRRGTQLESYALIARLHRGVEERATAKHAEPASSFKNSKFG
jgi:plasmid maintenance system antidote protein VapI